MWIINRDATSGHPVTAGHRSTGPGARPLQTRATRRDTLTFLRPRQNTGERYCFQHYDQAGPSHDSIYYMYLYAGHVRVDACELTGCSSRYANHWDWLWGWDWSRRADESVFGRYVTHRSWDCSAVNIVPPRFATEELVENVEYEIFVGVLFARKWTARPATWVFPVD